VTCSVSVGLEAIYGSFGTNKNEWMNDEIHVGFKVQ
jgi:hypothetical protein